MLSVLRLRYECNGEHRDHCMYSCLQLSSANMGRTTEADFLESMYTGYRTILMVAHLATDEMNEALIAVFCHLQYLYTEVAHRCWSSWLTAVFSSVS